MILTRVGRSHRKGLPSAGKAARLSYFARGSKENGWQAEIAAQGIAEMNRTARVLESSLRVHAENMTRFNTMQRWRFWLTGLAIAAASFGFFALGALL